MEDTNITATTVPQESSVIREMRNTIAELSKSVKAAEADKEALSAKLTDFERSKLETEERLRLELKDANEKVGSLSSLPKQIERYEGAFKGLFEAKLASLPDDVKPKIESLTNVAQTWDQKLTVLESAIELLPKGEAVGKAGVFANPTDPTAKPVNQREPMTPEQARQQGWAFKPIPAARSAASNAA